MISAVPPALRSSLAFWAREIIVGTPISTSGIRNNRRVMWVLTQRAHGSARTDTTQTPQNHLRPYPLGEPPRLFTYMTMGSSTCSRLLYGYDTRRMGCVYCEKHMREMKLQDEFGIC